LLISRPHRAGIVIAVLCLVASCRLGPTKVPAITVSSLPAASGTALRVQGLNWQPGERVTLGLAPPNSQPANSETLTTVLADASGSFVAHLILPAGPRWAAIAQIWVVAHNQDLKRVATATFNQTPPATAVPTSPPAATHTPSASTSAYVLGHVESIVVGEGSIRLRPIEGNAKLVTFTASTQVMHQGKAAKVSDIGVGALIEAIGQSLPGAEERIVAERIQILSGVATVEPTATPTATLAPLFWRGEYFGNTTFSGKPTLTRNDMVIDFQWQDGQAANDLPYDSFAVRWSGNWPFEAGAYRFQAQVDDGVRLWLDEHLIIDQWHQSIGALYSADAYLSTGVHQVRVEYFDAQGPAYARVWWDYRGLNAVQAFPDWKAEYYNNLALDGAPFLVVNDRTLDFNWGEGAPASGIPGDNFSARWTTKATLDEGIYRFSAQSDDGVRLWVDDTPVIDHWIDGGAATYTGEITLASGSHRVRVEYYEHEGLAMVKVGWELLPATPTPTRTEAPTLTPTQTPVPPTATLTQTAAPPTATATQTPVPPSATPTQTQAPPTATLMVEASVTPVTPEATPTP